MLVLGIESSCDETGVALYDSETHTCSHVLHSQIALHAAFGGVVPELASRDHIKKILPLINKLLSETGRELSDIDAIAYTRGPGLMGALWIGASLAHTLAWSLDRPLIGVHHMEGHLLAPMLEAESPSFPFLALLVSGGHTQIVRVDDFGKYEILGQTIDDAAGEAFDKIGKVLALPFPGGPSLAKLAEQGKPGQFKLTRPMLDRPGLTLSFSGLKTQTIQAWRNSNQTDQDKANLAWSFQDTVVETLTQKMKRAMLETDIKHLVVAGGVGANRALRARLGTLAESMGGAVFYPRPEFCTDNGAMIAYAGWARLQRGERTSAHTIDVLPRWSMEAI